MTIHTPHFSAMGNANDFSTPPDPTSLCRAPASIWSNDPVASSGSIRRASLFGVFSLFSVFSGAIDFAASIGRNTIAAPVLPFQSVIVGSHNPRHNSTALCLNPLSYGPDFVSFHEGVFCDMAARRTYDWDTRSLVDGKLKKRKIGYTNVTIWR